MTSSCQEGVGGEGRSNRLVDIAHQLWPVVDASCHISTEDPAKLSRVHPLAFDIVYLKSYIGWHECGHVGTEIISEDLFEGKLSALQLPDVSQGHARDRIRCGHLTVAPGNSSPISIAPAEVNKHSNQFASTGPLTNACSRANIEDPVNLFLGQWGKIQTPADGAGHDLVEKKQSF